MDRKSDQADTKLRFIEDRTKQYELKFDDYDVNFKDVVQLIKATDEKILEQGSGIEELQRDVNRKLRDFDKDVLGKLNSLKQYDSSVRTAVSAYEEDIKRLEDRIVDMMKESVEFRDQAESQYNEVVKVAETAKHEFQMSAIKN